MLFHFALLSVCTVMFESVTTSMARGTSSWQQSREGFPSGDAQCVRRFTGITFVQFTLQGPDDVGPVEMPVATIAPHEMLAALISGGPGVWEQCLARDSSEVAGFWENASRVPEFRNSPSVGKLPLILFSDGTEVNKQQEVECQLFHSLLRNHLDEPMSLHFWIMAVSLSVIGDKSLHYEELTDYTGVRLQESCSSPRVSEIFLRQVSVHEC